MNHNPIWKSDASFTLAETEFLMMHNPEDLKRLETTNERFLLGKTRNLVTNTVAMRDSESIKQIVDLGIYKGGSIALYALLFMPLKLVGIEYSKEPVEPLNNFIAKNGLQKQVSTYYGVNQADSKQLRQIVGAEFGGVELDLVVDDASHYYAETRSSFETLFPMLRPGGIIGIVFPQGIYFIVLGLCLAISLVIYDFVEVPGQQWLIKISKART
jgi:hypothetical protein